MTGAFAAGVSVLAMVAGMGVLAMGLGAAVLAEADLRRTGLVLAALAAAGDVGVAATLAADVAPDLCADLLAVDLLGTGLLGTGLVGTDLLVADLLAADLLGTDRDVMSANPRLLSFMDYRCCPLRGGQAMGIDIRHRLAPGRTWIFELLRAS